MRLPRVLVLLARVFLSVVAWILFWLIGFALFPIALLVWLITLPFDRNLLAQHLFTSWWAALYLWMHPGWRLRIEGREYEARAEEIPGDEIVERVDAASRDKYGWQERMIHPFRMRKPDILKLSPRSEASP